MIRPCLSNSRARVWVGCTSRRIICRARSGSSTSLPSGESSTAPSPSAAPKISPCVFSDSICWPNRLVCYLPRYKKPPARIAKASTLTARMRRVSGEIVRRRAQRRKRARSWARASGGATGLGAEASGSAVAVAVPDAVERLDLGKIGIDRLELFAQSLDVAVDRAVVDIDVLAIGRIHQLVAVLDVTRAVRERFEDQKLGHGQFDRLPFPGAQMPGRVEDQLTAHDDRLAVRIIAFARQLAAPDQGPDALDQQPLRKWLLDIVVGAHAQAQQLVDLVVLRGQENDGNRALPPQLAQQLHAVEARHLDVEHREIDRLGADPLQGFSAVAVAADSETLRFERHRHRGQNVAVVVDQSNRVRHLGHPPNLSAPTGPAAGQTVLSQNTIA